MKTAITLSLLPVSPTMPFVLGPDLDDGFRVAADLGFDAVEIFPPTLDSIQSERIRQLCNEYSLSVSTIGTGGGAVAQGLTLTSADSEIRKNAKHYVREIIRLAGDLGGSAIIGSMQGKSGERDKNEVLGILAESLGELGEFARSRDQTLLFEPLNRYESDLVNKLDDASELIRRSGSDNTKILADLFHMNIEEVDMVNSIVRHLEEIGHIHFVDSNRQVAGCGHSPLHDVFETLLQQGFDGYLAVEAFPLPDSLTAAKNAANAFAALVPGRSPG